MEYVDPVDGEPAMNGNGENDSQLEAKAPDDAPDAVSFCFILRAAFPALLAGLADQLGLAVLMPTLLDYLEEHDAPSPVTWTGIILTGQFFGNAIGSLTMGVLADYTSSRTSQLVSMIGDCLFFTLTGVLPYSHPIVLLLIRIGAGLMSPMGGGMTYIFERVPPSGIPTAVTLFIFVLVSSYAVGSVMVAALHSTIGWIGEGLMCTGFCTAAALSLIFLDKPPLSRSKDDKGTPEGVSVALRSPEFQSLMASQFSLGFTYGIVFQTQVFHWTEEFSFSVEDMGTMTLIMPFIIASCLFASSFIQKCLGVVRSVYLSFICMGLVQLLVVTVLESSAGFTAISMTTWLFHSAAVNGINTMPPGIAAKYTKNGMGAINGISMFAYTLGQAVAPLVASILYQAQTWLPWIAVGSITLGVVVWRRVLGQSIFNDAAVQPAHSSDADVKIAKQAELVQAQRDELDELRTRMDTFEKQLGAVRSQVTTSSADQEAQIKSLTQEIAKAASPEMQRSASGRRLSSRKTSPTKPMQFV